MEFPVKLDLDRSWAVEIQFVFDDNCSITV